MSKHRTEPSAEHGFSLIELMVVVAIAAILLAVALPSFNAVIAKNRVAGEANEFIAAINYARSEAIQRRTVAGVCASDNKTTCAGSWTNGWLVWADLNRDGDLDTDEVLRIGTISPKNSFTAASYQEARFTSRGLISSATPIATKVDFVLKPNVCKTGQEFIRTLSLTKTGQVRMKASSC